MNEVISVIVPVYNVAAYLPQCLDSILRQDYEKLEVILIDDGSKDESGAICDQYARQDSRIRVIHQKNAGAAAAKNAGLRIATGGYLSFVDSDDFLEPNVYEYMVAMLKETSADAAEFSFRNVYKNRTEEHPFRPGRSIADGKEYLVRFTKDWTCALLWNKLYKRSLFDGIFFEEGHKIDDEYFTYQGLMNAQTVVSDDKIIYNYRRRASSVMLSPQSAQQIILDRLDALDKRRRTVINRFPELRKEFDVPFLDALIYTSEYPDNSEESIRKIKQLLKAYLQEKEHTMPPRYFWKGLWKLASVSTEKLLKKCRKEAQPVSMQDYFS